MMVLILLAWVVDVVVEVLKTRVVDCDVMMC